MLSQVPVNLQSVKKDDLDCEILRAAIIGEFDAINLYDQMAALTSDPLIKDVLLDIAKEEKVHVGELQALLLKVDGEQVQGIDSGRKEVGEISGRE